ncbi:hypothetical protein M378DRAFT_838721 [Amanita muscaria Koide BX008]|uniref:Uncharacterized protein n=1 Tax=Amanita muscaria (strain Koide BX008) TaxID=946122 RepID=A0A0C2X3Y3_AMAMK|nr:hypothetical protein M378DRAFT_838721 [Amanita muscaria Koide BX008]
MSVSSTASLQRQHSFSPSSATGSGKRESPSDPPEEYLHERERNWNSPRPRWLQNTVTSVNGRKRADSLRSTGSSSQEVEHDAQPLSAPLPQSRPQYYHAGMQQPRSSSPSRDEHWSKPLDHDSHFPSPSFHSRSGVRSPSSGSRPNSRNSISKPTQIPARVPTKSAQLPLEESSSPPTVHHRQRGNQSNIGSHLRVDRDEDSASQDRTPTIRTVQPPPLDNLEGARSSTPQFGSSAHDRTALSGTIMSAAFKSSKHRESPSRARTNGHTSSLQTPRSSFSSSGGSLNFQSPSPPRDLPELPAPPPMSDEEEDADLNYSSIAWETPVSQENVAENGNLTTMKTPRPPGAWMVTPAQSERGADPPDYAQRVSESVNETEYDGGLVTPVASLSRGTGLQTPVAPGAWVPTPATVRKSILKVRFEPSLSERDLSAALTEDNSGVTEQAPDNSLLPSLPISGNARPTEALAEARSCTPELLSPTPKSRSPKSPRKSPKIRVLDAFGRETLESVTQENEQVDALNSSTSRNKSSIRIVDAMGREIVSKAKDGNGNNQVPEHSLPSPPLDRREALVRVRQGLSDLVQEVDEIDRAAPSKVQDHRIQELDGLSRQARAKREELATRLYTAETDLKSKMQAIRKSASMVQSARRSSWIPNGQWILWLALVQIILTIFLYRFAIKQARDIFLYHSSSDDSI